LYVKGICHLKDLDFDSSTASFIAAFTKNPFFIEPLQKLLSHHLLSRGSFEELTARTEMPEAHRKALEAYASLSWFYELDEKEAARLAPKLLKENPSSSRAIVVYVSYCVMADKKTDLFILAQRICDTAPNSALAMFTAGCHMALIGRSEAARSLLWAALRDSPSFAPAWVAYAITHWFDGDSRTSLNVILVASRAFPAMELLHLWAGHLHAECGDMALALACYRLCRLNGFVLNEIGCILLRQNRVDRACSVFERAVASPDRQSAYKVNYATALRRCGRYGQAVDLLTEVEAVEPENIHAILGLGFTLHLIFRVDEAIIKYNRVLALNPDNSFALGMLEDAVQRTLAVPVIRYCDKVDPTPFDEGFQKWLTDEKKICEKELDDKV
jgi:anaphase-promoting complex subunit 6